ncbi:DUF72 domain-containing protein [bacterium]|nr:DUF72 domain-containing protein [bacterium]
MIRIGTSGYSFKDWMGSFYPPGIAQGKMLDFYVQHFNTVEINSTYYKIPHPAVFAKLDQKVPSDFEFIVKINRDTTHKKIFSPEPMFKIMESVESIMNSGKLKGFLGQFPYSFKYSTRNLEHIIETRRLCRGYRLFVEFRHDSWLQEHVFKVFEEYDIGYSNVDEPDMPKLIPPQSIVTCNTGYVRFHGRNTETWWDISKGDRYDYEYSEDELKGWFPLIEKIASAASDTYLFFNNCHMGQAVKNAKMMRDLIRDQLNLSVC